MKIIHSKALPVTLFVASTVVFALLPDRRRPGTS